MLVSSTGIVHQSKHLETATLLSEVNFVITASNRISLYNFVYNMLDGFIDFKQDSYLSL